MPRFDFKCPSCGAIRKDVWVNTFLEAQDVKHINISPCALCNVPLEKLPAAPNFVVNGFNAKNGYSK
jgi:hypothetical protein